MNPLLELRNTIFNRREVGIGRVMSVTDNKLLLSTVNGFKLVNRNSLSAKPGDQISFEGGTAVAKDLIEARLQTHFL